MGGVGGVGNVGEPSRASGTIMSTEPPCFTINIFHMILPAPP